VILGVEGIVKKVLKSEKTKTTSEVSVTFVDDKMIRDLNRKFRRIDRATDVLSFEMGEGSLLGDIVISFDAARRNAKRYGISIFEEIDRLAVHGALHLMGFDHKKRVDAKLMRIREDDYLA